MRSWRKCPEGTRRNLETNRCKSIYKYGRRIITPKWDRCPPGYYKNKNLGKCVKNTRKQLYGKLRSGKSPSARTPKIKRCKKGFRRYGKTMKCKKIKK